MLRTGCAWDYLPHDFPPADTVYGYLRKCQADSTWERLHDALRREVRIQAGKNPVPTAAIMDSQSVKTTERGGLRLGGVRCGEESQWRKRHLLVDTLGLLWGLVVHNAGVQDRDGSKLWLERARQEPALRERLQNFWADGGYRGTLEAWVTAHDDCVLEIVRRADGGKGFVVLSHRWVVERTLGWLKRWRRLSKDYE